MATLAILATTLTVCFFGLGCVLLLYRDDQVRPDRFLAHLPAVGLGGTAWIQMMLSLAGLRPSSTVLAVLAITGLVALLLLRSRDQLPRLQWPRAQRGADIAIAAVLLITLVLLTNAIYVSPIQAHDIDAIAIWSLKAKAVFMDPIRQAPLFQSAEHYYSHARYPLLVPFQIATAYAWIGMVDVTAGQLSHVLVFLATGLLAYGVARDGLAPLLAAIVTATFLLLPGHMFLVTQGGADCSFVLYALGNAWMGWRFLRHGNRRDLIMAAIYAGLLALTKTEGLVTAAIHMLALVAFAPSLRGRRDAFIAGCASLVMLAPLWLWLRSVPDYELSLLSNLNTDYLSSAGWRLPVILNAFFRQTMLMRFWGLWFWLPLAVAIIGYPAWKRRGTAWLWLISSGQLLFYIAVYYITPFDFEWHVKDSISRLTFHFSPMVLVLVVAHLEHMRRHPETPGEAEPETAVETPPISQA